MTASSYRLLVVVLGMIVAIGPLSIDMYLPSLPTIQEEFHSSPAAVQLTLSAFLIGYALGQLVYGPLSDRYGRKPIMLGGISAFTLASLTCALATSVEMLVLLRFLQAVGGGAGVVLARAIIRDYFPVAETARLLSLVSVITLFAPMASPILGGYILVWAGWRSLFWVLTLLGTIYLLLIHFVIRESHPVEKRQQLNLKSTLDAYRQLMIHRRSFGYIICSTLSATAIFAYISSAPFVFIDLYGVRAENFGYLYGIVTSGLISCALINSRLVVRTGLDRMIVFGHGIRMLGVLLLVGLTVLHAGGIPGLLVALLLCVSPTVIININAATCLLDIFPRYSGTASSISGAAMFIGGSLSAPILGLFHQQSIMPMTVTITVFSITSLWSYWYLVMRRPAGS